MRATDQTLRDGEAPLILGGGIAGLTLALCLQRSSTGTGPRIIEAAPALAPLGVGLNLLPHAMRVFDALGLGEVVATAGVPISSMGYYTCRGQRVVEEPRGRGAGFRWPQVAIHRARLHEVLLSALADRLPAGALELGSRAEAIDGSGVVDVSTVAGRTRRLRGLAVIAADGIHSTTRACRYPDEGDPV